MKRLVDMKLFRYDLDLFLCSSVGIHTESLPRQFDENLKLKDHKLEIDAQNGF